jgi:fido (protein-threonine AMPylation protein)
MKKEAITMNKTDNQNNDFEEYIRQSEPNKKEKGLIWQTAIGLQGVDGLKPSAYLIETAKQNIEGDITFDEVKSRIDTYYKTMSNKKLTADDRTEEADKVSARIAEILSEKTFSFSAAEYLNIHRRLFGGIYKFAGKVRDYNITKAEWVLNGETVYYASADTLKATLGYDFNVEKSFDYKGLSMLDFIEHFTKFVSGLWQIHAFGEGNTRTTAVFAIKYLRTLGFDVNNSLFANNSWYFRNALVRANYSDFAKNIHATSDYLERFFRNLLLGENNILKNHELHINYDSQSAKEQEKEISKSKICTLNCTLEEHFVLEFIKDNPSATQKEIAAHIHKSERTVKTITINLQQKNLLVRKNGKRNGYWKIIAN